MKNSQIRKHLKLSSQIYSFDKHQLSYENFINKLSTRNILSREDKNSLNLIKHHYDPKNNIHNFLQNQQNQQYPKNSQKIKSMHFKNQNTDNTPYFYIETNPIFPQNVIIRNLINTKQELKPKQTSKDLKEIEKKIGGFKNNMKDTKRNGMIQEVQNKSILNGTERKTRSYSFRIVQGHKLRQNLNDKNYRCSTNNQWYHKAIDKHLNQIQNQKIDLFYYAVTQGNNENPHLLKKSHVTNLYPSKKPQTGFKRKSISSSQYEIRYI